MIPLQLTLKNFISYCDATLDFRGLHTACICGPNGAGKSGLLEAIAWSLWGESRAGTEDDIIHTGAKEARVDFIFQTNQQTYRVIRSRQRGQSPSLEFQIATSDGFRPLTERGVRATQEKILQHLKLDYDTFINSAYLRQGKADEFMLKRPGERKQVLASLLKLDHYDDLAEQAKDLSRQFKGSVQLLEQSLESIQATLQQRDANVREIATTESELSTLQQQQTADSQQLQQLTANQHQRQNWLEQLKWHRQQYDQITTIERSLQQELATTNFALQELEALLKQENQIAAGYAHFQQLQAKEEIQASKSQAYQDAQKRRSQLLEEQRKHLSSLEAQMSTAKAQLNALLQQEHEIRETLSHAAEVEAAMANLQQARDRVRLLDRLQTEATPLMHRRTEVQMQLDRAQTRLVARLEEIAGQTYRLQVEQQSHPQLQQAVMEVAVEIEDLEKKRVYQQRVREKGLERRNFMERLQAHQRDYEAQLGEMDQKIQMLQVPDAICPLCDRPLDEQHWDLVLQKHQTQQQEILNQLWVVREQLAVSEREIQILRQEYRQLDRELAGYDALRERRGSLQAQLEATAAERQRLQQMAMEREQLERSLHSGTFAGELYRELQQIEVRLEQLKYDEKDHALARGQVERWRWAEIKQAQIKDALRRQAQIDARKPELLLSIDELTQALNREQTDSEFQRQIALIDRHLAEIGYNIEEHNALRTALRQAQVWLARAEELRQAQLQYPQLMQRRNILHSMLQAQSGERQTTLRLIDSVNRQLQETPDAAAQIQVLEQQIQQRRTQLDSQFAKLGRLQQQQQHLGLLQTQLEEQQFKLEDARRKYRVYQELGTAFGKNGIQALMIENVLPQLEGETNQILARLTQNQLHVQFVTQRANRSSRTSSKGTGKLIDTLDIVIGDARGTRPYETYSGGEAFRINFAIRLALARLLAHRSGTALQMLIVDEGFGSQDRDGCDRLIAAINAIAPEFACILTVTHMPQFKEAFQARIEVCKTENGSQVRLSL